MAIKVVIECDVIGCGSELSFSDHDFLFSKLVENSWFYDDQNEGHYCPSCAQKAKLELQELAIDTKGN